MDLYCFISPAGIENNTSSGSWAEPFHDFCRKYLGSLTALSLSIVMFESFAESVLQLILMIYIVVFVGYNPGMNLTKGANSSKIHTYTIKSYDY